MLLRPPSFPDAPHTLATDSLIGINSIDDLRQFTTWLATGSVSADDPKTSSKLDINKFLGHLASNKATGKTRYRKIVAIKKFFAFLKENAIIRNNPAETVIPPLKEKRLPAVLKKNEYKALLFEASHNPRDYAIIQTILQTGLRISEVTNLEVGDIDLTNKILTVRQGKGKVDRIIDLPDIAVDALQAYLKARGNGSDEKIFLSRNRKGMYVTTVRLVVHKYLKKAGISKGAVHTLRHTFGTYKSNEGSPQQAAGYQNPKPATLKTAPSGCLDDAASYTSFRCLAA